MCKSKGRIVAAAATPSLQLSTDSPGNRDSRSYTNCPQSEILVHSLLMGKGRDRWMLRPECEESQDAAKPTAQMMAGELRALHCLRWSQKLGPLVHRKRQRGCVAWEEPC